MRPAIIRKLSLGFALPLAASLLGGCTSSVSESDSGAPERAFGAPVRAFPAAPAPEPAYGQNASGGVNAGQHRDAPYVVMVSFDGFRPDYLDRFPTPNFRDFAARGVRAEGMIPVFPTKTFPAHYAMATGLYADRHGLVGNTMFDPALDRWYRISDRVAVEDSSWYAGEPIWATAERQGMVAGSYFWVGSEAAVGGVRPTFWYRFTTETPGEARVDRVLEWLALPEAHRPHLVTLYFAETDHVGHDFGSETPELAAAVARVDSLFGRLLRGIEALPHGRDVYVLAVSDHGMAPFGQNDLIELETDRLPGVVVAATGPYATLHVPGADPARLRAVRDTVQVMVGERADAFLRTEMPERFHYRSNPRAGDIVVVARGRGMIVPTRQAARFNPGITHGWDNRDPDMAALFLAAGPGLPAGRVIPPFESVHLYPFVAHLLGLEPAEVDGRLEVLGSLLEHR